MVLSLNFFVGYLVWFLTLFFVLNHGIIHLFICIWPCPGCLWPRFFNYWDYQRAWFNAFLIQNKDFHHSWMFYFPSKHQLSSFPFWFHNWWTYFGTSIKILPKPILDGFELFNRSFAIPRELSAFSSLLFFFSKFGLTWIV